MNRYMEYFDRQFGGQGSLNTRILETRLAKSVCRLYLVSVNGNLKWKYLQVWQEYKPTLIGWQKLKPCDMSPSERSTLAQITRTDSWCMWRNLGKQKINPGVDFDFWQSFSPQEASVFLSYRSIKTEFYPGRRYNDPMVAWIGQIKTVRSTFLKME